MVSAGTMTPATTVNILGEEAMEGGLEVARGEALGVVEALRLRLEPQDDLSLGIAQAMLQVAGTPPL